MSSERRGPTSRNEKHGHERRGRHQLQGMFGVVLKKIQTLRGRRFVQMAYVLFCLHGTQLFIPMEPIRVDPQLMHILIDCETAALDEDEERERGGGGSFL